jgi:hypothetical protein
MNPRFLFGAMGLVAVLLTASCAPAAPTTDSVPPTSAPAETSVPQPTAAVEAPAAAPTEPAQVQPAPPSRGPNLQATDPATVSLASGELQLLEFFRFT